jgi:hypothetical protein
VSGYWAFSSKYRCIAGVALETSTVIKGRVQAETGRRGRLQREAP